MLFLDADITGTNTVEFLDSPFWKEDTCHGVQKGKSNPPDHVNLLELFERSFMTGKSLPRFFNKEKMKDGQPYDNSLLLIPDRINIIGSHIYNDDLNGSPKKGNDKKGTDRKDSDRKDSDNLICRPSILFDELHSFWFIEFLQNLCKDFLETIRQYEEDRPVSVIIDNSPGYVDIAPAVQEWLTDIGPDKGKFLIVSSLDMQDLLACGQAIHNLHGIYKRKWDIRNKFFTLVHQEDDSEPGSSPDSEEESFFLRLVEAHQNCKTPGKPVNGKYCTNGADLPFYLRENAKVGEAYLKQVEKYQGLVINRVPRLVKQGIYDYDTDFFKDCMDGNVIQCLLGNKRSNYFDWMVSYDEYIEYQFLLSKISRRSGRVSRSEKHMNEIMDDIKKRYPIQGGEEILFPLILGNKFHERTFEEIRGYLHDVQEAVEGAIHFADEGGFFSHLTRLIHDEWLPGNILRELSGAIRDVFKKMGKPFIESEPWGIGKETMDFEVRRYIDKLCKDIERQDIFDKNLSIPIERMKQIYPSIIAVFVLSSNLQCWLTPMREVFHQIIIDIFKIQVIHWKQQSEQSRKEVSIQKLLAAENLKYSEWNELKLKLQIQPYQFEYEDFSRLYHACTLAQAQLIDIRTDAEFLISLIQYLAMEDMQKGLVLPYIRGVVKDVIVKKKMSHKSGKKAIAEGLRRVEYMEEFSEVLERVLKRWEIA